jgi:NADPH2:quinone reductase
MMRAVEIKQAGPPEGLVETQRPVPELKAGEVLVSVAAAGVNRPDVLQRQGKYPPPPGASDLPGLEIAGDVVKVANGVERWKAGDAVCALLTGGGYAQYVAVPAEQCLPVPKGLSMAEAASLPETFFTVWHNVFERGALKDGESFLIQGGTSGIGVTAIQMAKAFGHRVFATAGSDEKCAACVKLGADRAINYRTEDFVEAVQQATGGKGVDVILDMVGGEYIPRELKALAADGRLVLIAFLGGAKATVNFADVMLRRLTITGSTLRARPVAVKAAIARALEEKVWPLVASAKIRPVVHATFPLARAAEAHALMESGAHVGKIVLEL